MYLEAGTSAANCVFPDTTRTDTVGLVSAADLVLPALLGEALAESSHGIAVGEENWGRILAANTAFASLLGYTPDELLTDVYA